jgi:hypothetical protein
MVMSLHKTDTLKWMFYKNGAYDYQISLVPGDYSDIWPDWLEIYPRSDWYQESTFPSGDDCLGDWTEKFYINSELIDSLAYVCDNIPNEFPSVHPFIFQVMADTTITAAINSDDDDGTIIWNSVSIPPQHGTFKTFGGYQRNFIYTPDPGFSGLDSVQIMAKDDKGATEIGVHYFDVQYLSLANTTIPNQFELYQNFPNPFNPVTILQYALPGDALVNITIYDIMGRQVKTLIDRSQTAGYKSIQWDATNDNNQPVSAGLYLYTIQAGDYSQTKKMVLLK